MNFQPELAELVLQGRKTVTRRLATIDKPLSPWFVGPGGKPGGRGLKVGRDYAVCPGRSKDQIGRVLILAVDLVALGDVDDREAKLEGFSNWEQFHIAWMTINGGYDKDALVWRVEFEVSR